jgi:two-component system, chemotaxis family, chemotaxis protein CheY
MTTEQNASTSILIVDDSEYIRTIMTTLFKKEGFSNIHVAADGQSAVEKFKEVSPQIVILDIMLPKKNGIDVLKDIMEINPKAIVIMISSLATAEYVSEAKRAGASYYFAKPFDNHIFIKVIKDFLNSPNRQI